MTTPSSKPVTRYLLEWRGGNQEALEQLMPLVYDELRRLAQHQMQPERCDHTLQATALVHEAYLRPVEMDVSWSDRVHFFALAARLMGRILVDHAKARRRAKRGGRAQNLTLDEGLLASPGLAPDVEALDEALNRLAGFDARKSQVIELHYFGGLTYDELAEAMSLSRATVHRELRLAKAWLYHELKSDDE